MTDKPLAGAQYQVYRSPIPAVKIVTLNRLNRAVSDVQRELEANGFYDEKLAKIDVYLSWCGVAYGWCWY